MYSCMYLYVCVCFSVHMCDCVHEHSGFTLPSLNISLEVHEGINISLISLDPQESIQNFIFVSGPMHSHKVNMLQFLDPSSETDSLDAYYLWILCYLLKWEKKRKNFGTCKLKSIQITFRTEKLGYLCSFCSCGLDILLPKWLHAFFVFLPSYSFSGSPYLIFWLCFSVTHTENHVGFHMITEINKITETGTGGSRNPFISQCDNDCSISRREQ